jgi:hypothetical protein
MRLVARSIVVLAIATVVPTVSASPASATVVTVKVRGSIHCQGGQTVRGPWIVNSAGTDGFADKLAPAGEEWDWGAAAYPAVPSSCAV